jgi:hypothetical protein
MIALSYPNLLPDQPSLVRFTLLFALAEHLKQPFANYLVATGSGFAGMNSRILACHLELP